MKVYILLTVTPLDNETHTDVTVKAQIIESIETMPLMTLFFAFKKRQILNMLKLSQFDADREKITIIKVIL